MTRDDALRAKRPRAALREERDFCDRKQDAGRLDIPIMPHLASIPCPASFLLFRMLALASAGRASNCQCQTKISSRQDHVIEIRSLPWYISRCLAPTWPLKAMKTDTRHFDRTWPVSRKGRACRCLVSAMGQCGCFFRLGAFNLRQGQPPFRYALFGSARYSVPAAQATVSEVSATTANTLHEFGPSCPPG